MIYFERENNSTDTAWEPYEEETEIQEYPYYPFHRLPAYDEEYGRYDDDW